MSNTVVIVPTYNEKENIEAIIRAIFSQEKKFDVLVVDDNSPDGTAVIVKNLQQEFSNLFIENRKEKTGLGTAYIHGFKWALKNDYEYIIEMDADFSHNPKDLIRLYNACAKNGADFSIGSRYLYNKINEIRQYFSNTKKQESYDETLKVLAGAKPVTDNFFDNVIVNDENSDIKKNRLELLQMFCKTYNNFIDFSKVEGA